LRAGDPVFVVPEDFCEDLPAEEQRFLKPVFEPSELARYRFPKKAAKRIIYLTKANDPGCLPRLESHLSRYREVMEERRETRLGRMQYKHLHWPREERFFLPGPKVLCVRKCRRPVAVYTEQPEYVMMAVNVIRSSRIDLKLLAAILNSRLIAFWLDQRGKKQGNQLQIDKEPLQELPLFCAASAGRAGAETVVQILERVERMLALQEAAANGGIPAAACTLQHQMDETDRQLDALVYDLYGLGDQEIRVIEQATTR
jgi:hypothetical protein